MDGRERQALAEVLAGTGRDVNDTARDVHAAVIERVRAGLAAGGLGDSAVATVAVEAAAGGAAAVYATVGAAMRVAGRASGALLRVTAPPDAATWSDTTTGAAVVAALDGARGDALPLDSRTAALAPEMAVRVDGRAVPPPEVAAALGDVTGSVWVFLHGLVGTEHQWSPRYAEAVRGIGATPVSVRYNSGLPVAENGRLAADLCAALCAGWPTPVEQIVLVGHSMGGLVWRSALAQAGDDDWATRVTDVVTLGTPHSGSPLERWAHRGLRLLGRSDVTRPFERLGNRRSAGIKDLRFGAILPGHWGRLHPDDVDVDPTWDVALPGGVRHHAVVAVLPEDPVSPAALLVGDGLVPPASATGRGGDDRRVTVLPSTGHLALLDHDDVAALLREVAARA